MNPEKDGEYGGHGESLYSGGIVAFLFVVPAVLVASARG